MIDADNVSKEKMHPVHPLGCLLLHGLGGGPYELGRLPQALREAGCIVSAPVLPGHEGQGSRMPDSKWQDWLATAHLAYQELVTAVGRPALVLGFSTGGTLGLRLALEARLAGLILLAPFLAIRHSGLVPFRALTTVRTLARLLSHLPRRSPPVRDLEMRRWASAQDRYKTFNLRATASALELIESVKPRVAEIDVPCLIQQGRLDTVVEPAQAAWLYDQLGLQPKRLIWYPRSDHLLALDRERFAVEADILRFVAELAGPSRR